MNWTLTTFNIQYCARKHWLRKRDALARMVRECPSDALCLQEVSAEGMAWIRAALPDRDWVGVGREDGINAGEHTPIFIRSSRWELLDRGVFWFSPTPDQPSVGWDAVHPRVCAWMRVRRRSDIRRELVVFNVHLDHRGRRAREESVGLLRRRIHAMPRGCVVVIAGDCNFRDDSPTYSRLVSGEPELIDCARAAPSAQCPGAARLRPTWNGFGLFRTGRARIDYVFVDPRLAVESYEVGERRVEGRRLSDHHPVTVNCRWRDDFQ